MDFLEHHITKEDFQPIKDKVEAIRKYPLPMTVKELRRFLTTFQFLSKFCSSRAESLIPPNKMLRKAKLSEQV